MKQKQFFIHGVSNFIIVLVIASMIFLTNTLYPIAFASGEGYFAIYKGNANNPNVSLMINVYWGTEYIEPMLEVLKQNEVKATFLWVALGQTLTPTYYKKY